MTYAMLAIAPSQECELPSCLRATSNATMIAVMTVSPAIGARHVDLMEPLVASVTAQATDRLAATAEQNQGAEGDHDGTGRYHCVPPSLSFALTASATAPRAAEARCRCKSRVTCPRRSGSGWAYSARDLPKCHMAPAHWAGEGLRNVIKSLPTNLSLLDRNELRDARQDRDERMSLLFHSWPSLSKIELRELRKLNDERQRLARHVGILRRLQALRAS